jgi:hypothetical protein
MCLALLKTDGSTGEGAIIVIIIITTTTTFTINMIMTMMFGALAAGACASVLTRQPELHKLSEKATAEEGGAAMMMQMAMAGGV